MSQATPSGAPKVDAEQATSSTDASGAAESQLAKYKRLLSMAKSSLESNQKLICSKDAEITQLQQALKDQYNKKEKARRGGGINAKGDAALWANAPKPRQILRRVDCEEVVWALIEYEIAESASNKAGGGSGKMEADLSWSCFKSEEDFLEFIARVPGKPLTPPPRCLSPEESKRIENDSKGRLERITEEFRRFKVKSEIIRRQKEAETQQMIMKNTNLAASISSAEGSSSMNMRSNLDRAILNSAGPDGTGGEVVQELLLLREQLNEKERSWKESYEKVVRENEVMKNRGDDSLMAAQWRDRYNALLMEKEEIAEKCRVLSRGTFLGSAISSAVDTAARGGGGDGEDKPVVTVARGVVGSTSNGPTVLGSVIDPTNGASDPTDASPSPLTISSSSGSSIDAQRGEKSIGGAPLKQLRPIEQLYLELKDEYKEYRRRTASLEQQRKHEIEALRNAVAAAAAGSSVGPHANAKAGLGGASDGGELSGSSNSNTGGSKGLVVSGGGMSNTAQSNGAGADNGGGASTSNLLTERKQAYIRQMVLQYLSCRDPEVKVNIESALVAMFRFNDAERRAIGERRAGEEESGIEYTAGVVGDYLGGLGGLVGLGGSTS